MHSCSAYPYRSSYAVSGSPLRGYHSLTRHDDNVFPSFSSARSVSSRCRRLSSAAADCRLKSSGSDGRKSPSFGSGSPDGASHMDCSLEYLADLVKEKKDLEMFGDNFQHVDRLLSEEISRVRGALFQTEFVTEPFDLPEPIGDVVTITEKIYVPKREYPDYNFVGRILGPRGMTAKQLEQETGCKIMVRGKGSMRDKRKPEGTDELKRKQLMELAIINGTYRPFHKSGLCKIMQTVPISMSDHIDSCFPANSNRILTPVPLVSPIRAPIFVSPTSSPNSVSVQKSSNPGYIGAATQQPFDYSSFMK
ncbi:KH domain protein [Ancylostoma ceylanicum]|uniref:KH domain protein n=1 Tax=Ancylostoma ceylanicum TaxID=53326 RepID=A0A0D6LTW7_9BILA|nr:KH domain protein [Ancylostoma ceylanicum]